MTDRLRALDDEALGRALAAIAGEIEWPAPRDVAADVTRTLRDQERMPALARPRPSSSRRRTVLLVAAVLLLALAAVAAKVIIDLGAITIDTIPGRPTALPSAVASGPTLGHPATLPEAEAEAGFPAPIPDELGTADAVWVDRTPDGARIVLAWAASDQLPAIDGLPWGALLSAFRGDAAQVAKLVFSEGEGTLQGVHVDGHDAWWITGEHELDLVMDDGTYTRYRVAGNVLVWNTGEVVLRLETALDREAAVRIAKSIPG